MLAGYLFQPDKHYETSLDTGDQGYAEHIEALLEKANFFYETICKREPYFQTVMKVKKILFS